MKVYSRNTTILLILIIVFSSIIIYAAYLGYREYISEKISIISGYPSPGKRRIIEAESPGKVIWTPGLIGPSQNTIVVRRGEIVVLKMKLVSLKNYNNVIVYSCPILEDEEGDYCSAVELAALKGEVVNCFPEGIGVKINGKPYLKLDIPANKTVDIEVEISIGSNVKPGTYKIAVGVATQMPPEIGGISTEENIYYIIVKE